MNEKFQASYDTKRQTLGKIFPIATPFTVILDSSEICNFKCNYCFRSGNDPKAWGSYAIKKNKMSWDVFTKTVDQIKQFPENPKLVSLSNHGEPLSNRRLPDMVRYIKEQGIKSRVSIHTNASYLDEKYAKELALSGIDKVVVSLQGMDSDMYESVCGYKIDFEKFYDALSTFYHSKNGEMQLNIKIMDVAVKGREEEFYERFSPIADRVFIEQVVPIWKNVGDGAERPETMTNKYGGKFKYQECCPLLFDTIVVTPEGDVYPCTQITSTDCLGNINEATLVEMWNSDQRKELLRRQLLLQAPESCNGCYIRQNSIFTPEDMIDDYREEILERLK